MHLPKLIDCTPRVYCNINYGVIMMHQCRFNNCNRSTILEEDVDNQAGYACMRAEGVQEISASEA